MPAGEIAAKRLVAVASRAFLALNCVNAARNASILLKETINSDNFYTQFFSVFDMHSLSL